MTHFLSARAVMNLLLHISRQYPQKGRGTVFLVTNFAFVVAVLKASFGLRCAALSPSKPCFALCTECQRASSLSCLPLILHGLMALA